MKIAVTYDNGNIFQHFGKTKQFKIYEIEDGNIINREIVDTNGTGHGALAVFLKALRVKVLICGGIGAGAQNALADAKIELYGGVSGSADDAAAAYAKGELQFNPDIKCDHHSEHHEGSDCGHGGCSEHNCHN